MARPRKASCCSTCRKRKVRCDGSYPRCNLCTKGRRECTWASPPSPRQVNGTNSPRSTISNTQNIRVQPPISDVELKDPREALQDEQVARLYRHYVRELAPWYDLLDSNRHFADHVPYLALDNPLLFHTILAFAAVHLGDTLQQSHLKALAEQHHMVTVRLLLDIVNRVDTTKLAETVAATCLLTSFEIIADYPGGKNHLHGTQLFLSSQSISVNHDLISAGFWNYLREDISIALFEKRALKIDLDCFQLDRDAGCEDCHANYATYLLGSAINACFREDAGSSMSREVFVRLIDNLEQWKASLPLSFRPFSTASSSEKSCFARKWFLRDWHAAAIQYYHVAKSILHLSKPDAAFDSAPNSPGSNLWDRITAMREMHRELAYHANQVCAISIASDSMSVWVNSFAPIAFCGIWISDSKEREELVRHMRHWGAAAGWPIERLIGDLRESWRGRGEQDSSAFRSGEAHASSGTSSSPYLHQQT